MEVKVKKDDVIYICKSEEQLKLFLDAGYEVVEEVKKKAEKKVIK